MAFDLDPAYKQVPERIADFKAKHPEGSLQSEYAIEAIGGREFVVVKAYAYRSPDDPRPGIGLAWEQFPGTTAFTRNSELMNAETSSWGRAIVAVLASESKAIASAEDVRNRQAEEPPRRNAPGLAHPPLGKGEPADTGSRVIAPQEGSPPWCSQSKHRRLFAVLSPLGIPGHEERCGFLSRVLGREVDSSAHVTDLEVGIVEDAVKEEMRREAQQR